VQALTATGTLSDSFTAVSFDGTSQLVTITIHGSNDPALIGGDSSASVSEDGTLVDSGALTISDTDTGEGSFQPAGTTTTYGSYTLDSAGNWAYTLDNANVFVQGLNTGQTLNDSLTALGIDGTSQVVSITIHGLDEPPGVVILNGDGTPNNLVIDLNAMTYTLDNGMPQSLVNIGSLTFNGGNDLGDSITITGGTFGTVTYDYTNAKSIWATASCCITRAWIRFRIRAPRAMRFSICLTCWYQATMPRCILFRQARLSC
jgi:VCBS repeat-containing protein